MKPHSVEDGPEIAAIRLHNIRKAMESGSFKYILIYLDWLREVWREELKIQLRRTDA